MAHRRCHGHDHGHGRHRVRVHGTRPDRGHARCRLRGPVDRGCAGPGGSHRWGRQRQQGQATTPLACSRAQQYTMNSASYFGHGLRLVIGPRLGVGGRSRRGSQASLRLGRIAGNLDIYPLLGDGGVVSTVPMALGHGIGRFVSDIGVRNAVGSRLGGLLLLSDGGVASGNLGR